MTDSRRRRNQSADDPEERKFRELLYEGMRDKSDLERKVAEMRNIRAETTERAECLYQEINMLKEKLENLRREKDESIKRLKNELQMLTSAKQDTLGYEKWSNLEEVPRRRVKTLPGKISKRASVSGVPNYDRKYSRKRRDRMRRVDRGGFELPNSVKSDSSTDNSKAGGSRSRSGGGRSRSGGSRRRSMPSAKAEIRLTQDKIESAAQAFLDTFGQLNPKVIKALWKRSPETDEKGSNGILHTSRLAAFLHELVVHAFKLDNPEHPAPSVRRTKPLVSLLKYRLAPFIEDKEYLELQHFQMFPMWLGSPGISFDGGPPEKPSASDVDWRRDLREGDMCLIWIEGLQTWCEGQIISIKSDEQGEWLVVRYDDNSPDMEVQRYSKLLKDLKILRSKSL